MTKDSWLKNGLLGLAFALFMAALYLIFLYVPTEAQMGIVQRIFYFHVPVDWIALLGFLIVFVGSIMYLWKRSLQWDIIARSAAEIGIIFTTLALFTGSIWAKPIWGVWWTWTPRLTSTLILWLIYLAYILVRQYATEESQGARFASVVGIVGFLDVPIVILAITIWPTVHPGPIIFEGGLDPSMKLTLMVSITAFTLLFVSLLLQRISIATYAEEIKRLKEEDN